MPKFAFRCRNCGALEPPEAAGENSTPGACHVCGHGVRFDELTGAKSYDRDNWQVLTELPPGERDKLLKFHRLEASDLVKPRPAKKAEEAQP